MNTSKYQQFLKWEKEREEFEKKLLNEFNLGMRQLQFLHSYWPTLCFNAWDLANHYQIFFHIENIYMHYGIKAIFDPKFIRLIYKDLPVFTFYFHQNRTKITMDTVNSLLRLKETTELGEIYFVTKNNGLSKNVQESLIQQHINLISFNEFIQSVFFILHCDYFLDDYQKYNHTNTYRLFHLMVDRIKKRTTDSLIRNHVGFYSHTLFEDCEKKINEYERKMFDDIKSRYQMSENDIFMPYLAKFQLSFALDTFSFEKIDRSRQTFTQINIFNNKHLYQHEFRRL